VVDWISNVSGEMFGRYRGDAPGRERNDGATVGPAASVTDCGRTHAGDPRVECADSHRSRSSSVAPVFDVLTGAMTRTLSMLQPGRG